MKNCTLLSIGPPSTKSNHYPTVCPFQSLTIKFRTTLELGDSPSLSLILIQPFTASINSQNTITGCNTIQPNERRCRDFARGRILENFAQRVDGNYERGGDGESGADGVKPSAHVAKARACQRRESTRERARERERQYAADISGLHPYADPH